MSKKIYLQIAEPCHENWNTMSATAQGRHCQSCCKQVIDFTAMSDKQILDMLSKSGSGACGRFKAEQLDRPIIKEISPMIKPYRVFAAALIPAMLMVNEVTAQQQKNIVIHGKSTVQPMIMGLALPARSAAQLSTHISGQVINEKGEPIPFADISNTNAHAVADDSGNFKIDVNSRYRKLHLTITSVGYNDSTITLEHSQAATHVIIRLTNKTMVLPEAVVASSGYHNRMGKFVCVARIGYRDTAINKVKATIAKALKTEPFTVFPNPVRRGAYATLLFKKTGQYNVQLTGNDGKICSTASLNITGTNQPEQLAIPATLGSGTYYIKSISATSKKQYTAKIIIE